MSDETLSAAQPKISGKQVGFMLLLGTISLLFFSLLKFPTIQINQVIQSQISAVLAPYNIAIRAEGTNLSLLTGIRYKMEKVSIYLPEGTAPLKLERLEFSPSLLKLLTGKMGVSVYLEQTEASTALIEVAFSQNTFSVDYDIKKLKLGELEGLQGFLHVKVSGDLTGTGSVTYNSDSVETSQGQIDLLLQNFVLPEQSLTGVNDPMLSTLKLPKIGFSNGTLSASIDQGKLRFKKFELGKSGLVSDSLAATLMGEIKLAKNISKSDANLEVNFKLGEDLMKTLTRLFMDQFIAPGKRADGSYNYLLKGSIDTIVPTPKP